MKARADGPFSPLDWMAGAVSGLIVFFLAFIVLAGFKMGPGAGFPGSITIGFANGYLAMRQRRNRRERRERKEGHCRRCDYDLTGNTSGVDNLLTIHQQIRQKMAY